MMAALDRVIFMSETVPHDKVQQAVQESVGQLRKELDMMAQVRDVNRLMHNYVFPLACASPFLVPLAREQDYADIEVSQPLGAPGPADNEPQVHDTVPPDDEQGDICNEQGNGSEYVAVIPLEEVEPTSRCRDQDESMMNACT